MKSTRLALILSPLALAGAAAVMWDGDGEVVESERQALTRGARTPRSDVADPGLSPRRDAKGTENCGSTAADSSSERIALRLHELTEVLGLTSDQRREVRNLLERSSVSYDELEPIIGSSGEPLARLTKVQAQEAIHDLLDPLQQIEFEDQLIEDQLWWADVIARLESDLEQATDPEQDFIEPAELPPPAPMPHRGGNIFDLLNPPEP